MTEETKTKGEPEPPDTKDGTTAARQQMATTDESEVQAYHQPTSETGEPEPPDTDV
jgi:hypothetical protein